MENGIQTRRICIPKGHTGPIETASLIMPECTVVGTMTANDCTVSGTLTTSSISFSGPLTVSSLTATGAISGDSLVSATSIQGTSATITGPIQGTTITGSALISTGTITGLGIAATSTLSGNAISGGSLIVSGNTTSGSLTSTTAEFGTPATNYLSIEADGTDQRHGDACQWDDVYVPSSKLDTSFTSAPVEKQFQNDGAAASDYGLEFDGTTQYGDTVAYGGYLMVVETATGGDWTFEAWIKPTSRTCVIWSHGISEMQISLNVRHLRFTLGGVHITSDARVNLGAWNHIVVAHEWSTTTVTLCVNNVSEVFVQPNAIALTASIGMAGKLGENMFEGVLDLVGVYNVVLSASQITQRYNGGVATTTLPSGITSANRVLYCEFATGSGSIAYNTGSPAYFPSNFTLTGSPGWVDGAVDVPGSSGVFLLAFEASATESVGFAFALPHGWLMESEVRPHIHVSWVTPPTISQTISFKMEYTIAQPYSSFPTTTTATATYTATGAETAHDHQIIQFPAIDMTGVTVVSSEILVRLWRDAADTFPEDVFLINAGLHFQYDMLGSRQEYVK